MTSWLPVQRRDSDADRNSSGATAFAMELSPTSSLYTLQQTPLKQLQQHSYERKKPVKGCHVLPQDYDSDDNDSNGLREPLQCGEDGVGGPRRKSKRSILASSRVQRDQLLRKMEELIMKEAELASAYELFDYTRKRCSQEHEQIVTKLNSYEAILHEIQTREAVMSASGIHDMLQNEQERERWRRTKDMVAHTLPELLTHLEDNIDINSEKIRSIQEKMEEIRAHRLAVREEIALKEEDIALALQ